MTPQNPENSPIFGGSPERRIHGRVHVQFDPHSVIYAELGQGEFGIVTNISEGGLAMQTAKPLVKDDLPDLRFRLTPSGNLIRPTAHVAWKTISKRMAGVQFLAMSTAESIELRSWINERLPIEGSKQWTPIDPAEREGRTATPESDRFSSKRFERLQQVQTEPSLNHVVRRKLFQWTVWVVLATIFVASLFVLWHMLADTR